MDFIFDIDKTVAAVGHLTKKSGGKISPFLLLKMLYCAERNALSQWNRPITGDSFASLPKGPILSRTYNLIEGEVARANSDMIKWSMHFAPRDAKSMAMILEPDMDYLSEREVEALNDAFHEINGLVAKHGLIAEVLHGRWPEWKDPKLCGKGSTPITLEDVLSELFEDENDISRISSNIQAVSSAKASLQVA